jgi:hypothetical protein
VYTEVDVNLRMWYELQESNTPPEIHSPATLKWFVSYSIQRNPSLLISYLPADTV